MMRGVLAVADDVELLLELLPTRIQVLATTPSDK